MSREPKQGSATTSPNGGAPSGPNGKAPAEKTAKATSRKTKTTSRKATPRKATARKAPARRASGTKPAGAKPTAAGSPGPASPRKTSKPGAGRRPSRNAVPGDGPGAVSVDEAKAIVRDRLAATPPAPVEAVGRPDAAAPQAAAAIDPVVRHRMIAEAAFRRAQRRGFRDGTPERDWLEAEAEIDARLRGRVSAG